MIERPDIDAIRVRYASSSIVCRLCEYIEYLEAIRQTEIAQAVFDAKYVLVMNGKISAKDAGIDTSEVL